MVNAVGSSSANYLFSRSINSRLYAHALALAYRNGVEVYDPDFSLSNDPEFWEKVQRDPVIKHAMDARLHSAAGRDWQCNPGTRNATPEDEKAARVGEELLEQIEDFTHGRFNLSKGVFLGETFAWIEGERRPIKIGGKVQNWWVPRRLHDIDKRRIRMRPVWTSGAAPGQKITAVYELFNLETLGWVPLNPYAPIIHFKYDDEESRLGHGRGVAEAIYFHHYAKGVVFTEGLEGLEKWARGMIVAKLENKASELDNETTRNEYITQLDRQRRGGVMVIDKDDELEVQWPEGTGNEMVFQWLQYLDAGIVTVILGQVVPQSGGALIAEALTRAITEAGSSETLLGYDRTVLYQALTRDLMGHIWHWNRPQLAALGLADAKRPVLTAAAIDDTDPKEAIDIIATARTAGIPLLKKEVYERIGFSMPGATDDVFEPILDPGAQMATDENGKPVPNKMAKDPVGNVKGPAEGASPPPSRPSDTPT